MDLVWPRYSKPLHISAFPQQSQACLSYLLPPPLQILSRYAPIHLTFYVVKQPQEAAGEPQLAQGEEKKEEEEESVAYQMTI